MTDPLIYSQLEDLRAKLLVTRSDVGVAIIEKAIEELERLDIDYAYAVEEINRLNKVVESQLKTIQNYLKNNSLSFKNTNEKNWELTPKPARPLEYGDQYD